jgi:hypothetical protein
VQTHLRHLCEKLGTHTRADTVTRARASACSHPRRTSARPRLPADVARPTSRHRPFMRDGSTNRLP